MTLPQGACSSFSAPEKRVSTLDSSRGLKSSAFLIVVLVPLHIEKSGVGVTTIFIRILVEQLKQESIHHESQ